MNDLWYEAASSIGIAVTGKQDHFILPEDAMLLLVENFNFKLDRKEFGLMKLWLSEYSQFLRVDLLKSRINNLVLESSELAVLGALVSFCFEKDGSRWSSLLNDLQKKCSSYHLKLAPDEVLNARGRDSDFIKFGVEITHIKMPDNKKLMSSKFIFSHNIWMLHRKLMGPIIRADFLTAFKYSIVENPFKAKQILGCSQASSYKNWNELEDALSYELLSKVLINHKMINCFNKIVTHLLSPSRTQISSTS